MSLSGPMKACPRCTTQLPAQATFCGNCGWQFSASSNQSTPGGWPQNQPAAPAPVPSQPPAMPGYPQAGQPGMAGYAPVAAVPQPRKGLSRKMIAIILIVVVLVGGAGYFLLGGTDRHGLPSNVPLPKGAAFKLMKDESGGNGAAKDWYWTVDGPNTPSAMRDFYQSNFPSNGWTVAKTLGSSDDFDVIGCQGNQMAYVSMATSLDVFGAQGSDPRTISAPSGGSALRVIVNSQPDAVSAYCK